jgi:ketosteroid isomerase-like protein
MFATEYSPAGANRAYGLSTPSGAEQTSALTDEQPRSELSSTLPGRMLPVNHAEVVRAWLRATNDSDFDAAVALIDPEFEMVEAASLPGAAHVRGVDQLRSYFYGWQRNWSDWDWREEEIVEVPPDRVVLMATLWLRGLRSGIEVERHWAYVFTMRAGRLLRQDGYDTKQEALSAVGLH